MRAERERDRERGYFFISLALVVVAVLLLLFGLHLIYVCPHILYTVATRMVFVYMTEHKD